MPKLYKRISKRLAKKLIGRRRWYQLQPYANGELTEGVLISTCRGYNERITKITPVIADYLNFERKLARGHYVIDLDIETEGENFCSLIHCCIFPRETKEEILEYFKTRAEHPHYYSNWDFGRQDKILMDAVKNGQDPFDEDGCIKEEYKVKEENGQ